MSAIATVDGANVPEPGGQLEIPATTTIKRTKDAAPTSRIRRPTRAVGVRTAMEPVVIRTNDYSSASAVIRFIRGIAREARPGSLCRTQRHLPEPARQARG